MVKIYGCSDDLVEIEGSEYYENEIGCYNSKVKIWFKDGTVVLIGYPKIDLAVWWISIVQAGTGVFLIRYCNDEDADIYSDVFEIDSEIERHEVIYNEETNENS